MGRAKKLKRLAIAERRAEVLARYVRGLPQTQIASELGISRFVVCKDLQAIQRQWEQNSLSTIHAYKQEQLAKLDEVERQAWLAWHECQKRGEPDPRFLQVVANTIKTRCQILNILGPSRPPEVGDTEQKSYVVVLPSPPPESEAEWQARYGHLAHRHAQRLPAAGLSTGEP